MGMFDKMFKKEPKKENKPQMFDLKEASPMRSKRMENGAIAYEYYDENANFKQFYDTTRLIVSEQKPININGETIYECMASWYNENDAIMFDEKGFDMSRRTQYQRIFVGIDPDLMNNPEYAKVLMTQLLQQDRVKERIRRGLMTEEELKKEAVERGDESIVPCGRYVGGMIDRNGRWGKSFSVPVGKAMHNCKEMANERQEYKEMLARKRREEMERKREEMDKLKRELDEYEEEEVK